MSDLDRAVALVARRRRDVSRPLVVALTGIDASGKGYLAARLVDRLASLGLRAEIVHADDWLRGPVEDFYRDAIRFDEMFRDVGRVLRDHRDDIDVLVIEGIFLLKRELRDRYDLALWVDCPFATALERAVARAQEGLPPEDTVRAYRTVYFPAQEIHFERDAPRDSASAIIENGRAVRAARSNSRRR